MSAAPFISLGLKGTNYLIDKHFHKLPDSAMHANTYHPKNLKKVSLPGRLKKKKRRDSSSSRSSSPSPESADKDLEEEEERKRMNQQGIPRYSGIGPDFYPPRDSPVYAPQRNDTPPIYSQEPPRQRPQYIPSPPPVGSQYPLPPSGYQGAFAAAPPQDYRGAYPVFPPPPSQPSDTQSRNRRRGSRDRDSDYHSDSYSAPRRPKAVTRRSSSYHGPRSRNDDYGSDDDRQTQVSTRGGSGSRMDRMKDRTERYKLKDEMGSVFTTSKPGMAGGAVGAIIGGWAAKKAQIAYGREKNGSTNNLVTLLGAAIGGLGVNVVVDKWEESRENATAEQGEWDDKFGNRDETGGSQKGGDIQRGGAGRSERGGQSESGSGRRKTRSNRDSKVYDSDSDGGRGKTRSNRGSKVYDSDSDGY